MWLARAACLLAIPALVGTGCERRNAPYRFRAPLVSSVRAEQPGAIVAARSSGAEPERPAARTLSGFRAASKMSAVAATPRAELPGGPLADALRALVGTRKPDSSQVGFLLDTLSAIGARPDERLRNSRTAQELIRLADARGAAAAKASPLLGDIAVFDQVFAKEPSSVLGVVVATHPNGTVEFVYLARGVVRRGFVNLSHRASKRDAQGRVLNTILRQRAGRGRKGAGDLASDLFSTYLLLDRLHQRSAR